MSSEVPEGWTGNKLHEICDGIFVGHVGSTAEHYTDSSGVKFIRTGDLKNGKIRVSNTKYITREFHQKLTKSQLNPGDILVSRVGDTGQAALVPEQIGEANCANIIIIKPSSGISSEFLLSNINSEDFFIQAASVSIGSAQSVLNINVIKDLRTLVPPLPEQKKIASILTSVDEVIENTQKQIDKLQDLKKATMNELLTKGIGHTEFKDSELGRIPKSWDVVSLGEIGSLKNGLNKSKESFGHGTKFVNISDAYPVELDCNSLERLDATEEEIKDYSLESGDLIFVRSSVKLGGVAIPTEFVRCSESVVFCGFMIRFRPELKELDSSFLRQYLMNDGTRIRMERLATGGANININQESLSQFKVLIPSLEEQKYCSTVNAGFEDSLKKYQEKLSQTQFLKKSLMQDLLTGKVRVSVN